MELLSIVLRLKPLPAERPPESWPAWWGRAAHALLFSLVHQQDPELAAALHAGQGPQPFTVSNLLGRFEHDRPVPEESYTLRLCGLNATLCEILRTAAHQGALAPGQTLELDFQPFRIEGLATEEHPWARAGRYADLAADALAPGQTPRRFEMQFASPTTFKSGGKHVPIPMPDLVFGSLLDRWNALAPLAFPAEARRYASECLALSRYRLQSRAVPIKGGGLRVGAVGKATFATLNYDHYWMGVMAALARFALFGGVGGGTTMGMGQCRLIAAST
ncbi:MAG: CRISPR system precrRNA processing endoribonuclease RAMP protein Cas6 [Caldilineales bacterium]|nr:CRISPR system precrRNA processing endoribonuclease RAMP protein Cas6 [Caldilineales bacterium]